MIVDPLDQALTHVITQTPILGVVIIGMVWLARRVIAIDKKLTDLNRKVCDHIKYEEKRDREHASPA